MLLKHISSQITCPNWGKLVILFTLFTALSNCGSLPQQSQNTNLQVIKKDTAEALSADARVAEQQASPLREQQLIDIAQRLLNIGEIKSSSDVIKLVDKSLLNDTDYRSYIIAASDIFTQNQSILEARLLLEEPRLTTLWDQFSIDQQKHLHLIKADIYNQIGDVQASLNERIALATLLSDKQEIKANDDALWQQLSAFTQQELVKLSLSTPHQVLSGWYQLAAVSKEHQGDLESQNKAILNWKRLNPNHPASQQLPADLRILETLITERPTNIALLLPLEGKLAKAGQTIRDGFFSAYYKAQEKQESVPEIKLYDTSSDDVNSLYDRAVLDGADLVIGPLSKDNVETLQLRPSLITPVLALNYTENNASFIANKPFFQFGLSLEDEAAQAAERAWLEGHRYALVISSEANWSQRAANTFIERWEELGGKVIRNSRFNKDSNYSENIENAFNIKKSKRRATRLKRLFGQTFEFEPRRRKDIDMIFLVSRSREGRQIKPTLNFHYASRVPVYATSQIFSQLNSADKNSDLNGIRLTTLPGLLNSDENALAIDKKVSPGYERLYALGVDSFLLYPRLRQLQQLPNQQLFGATGKLSLDQDKRVVRKQLWAEVRKGELHPLPTLVLTEDKPL